MNALCLGRSDPLSVAPDTETPVSTGVGPDGYFYIFCPDDPSVIEWNYVTGEVYPRGVYADVKNDLGNHTATPFTAYNAERLTLYAGSNRQAHVLTALERNIPTAQSRFNRRRSRIEVRVWENSTDQSHYSPADDRINLRNASRIFNADGYFVILHEYGHAFHWHAIERPQYDSYEGHALAEPSSITCALAEGFADFFATWIGESFFTAGSLQHDWNLEHYPVNTGDIRIEGTVAGFLYDLVDNSSSLNGPSNESGDDDDLASYSASDIATILSTCDMPTAELIDGVDRFVYCAENTLEAQDMVNPATGATYFAARRPTYYTSFSVGSHGLARDVVRRTWLYDIFGQGSLR